MTRKILGLVVPVLMVSVLCVPGGSSWAEVQGTASQAGAGVAAVRSAIEIAQWDLSGLPPARPGVAAVRTAVEIAKATFPSTVMIIVSDAQGSVVSQGSGFFVGPGKIVTNHHVIQGSSSGVVKLIRKQEPIVIDTVLAVDEGKDLALISVGTFPGTPLPVAAQDTVDVGSRVYAIGNPLGLEGTFSEGIISGVRTFDEFSLLQITAPISPGSSGGPIVNDKGQLVGVAVATFMEGQNLNFAIPGKYVKELLNMPPQRLTLSQVPCQGKTSQISESRAVDALRVTAFSEGTTWQGGTTDVEFSIRNVSSQPVSNVKLLIVFPNWKTQEPIDTPT